MSLGEQDWGEMSMFCKSCGKNIPDDSNFCQNCGVRLKTNVDEQDEDEDKVLYEFPIRTDIWSDSYNGGFIYFWTKSLTVAEGKHTLVVPFDHINSVSSKKGGWFSYNELSIGGVGSFRLDDYKDLRRILEILHSLRPNLISETSD